LWPRESDLLDILGRGSNSGRHLVGCLGGMRWSGEIVDGDDGWKW
jgi:hypothetical protein